MQGGHTETNTWKVKCTSKKLPSHSYLSLGFTVVDFKLIVNGYLKRTKDIAYNLVLMHKISEYCILCFALWYRKMYTYPFWSHSHYWAIRSKNYDMNNLPSTCWKYHVFYTKEILNVTWGGLSCKRVKVNNLAYN